MAKLKDLKTIGEDLRPILAVLFKDRAKGNRQKEKNLIARLERLVKQADEQIERRESAREVLDAMVKIAIIAASIAAKL